MTKAISFEAIKLALKQDKNGHVLTLAIHPNETPDELWRTPTGQRYGVALVLLDEEGEAHADESEGLRCFNMAQVRCRSKPFAWWITDHNSTSQEDAKAALRKALGIASTTEIRDDPEVRKRFLELMERYDRTP